ncbi:glutaredoxin 2 [Pseudoalteromonas sp. GB56]
MKKLYIYEHCPYSVKARMVAYARNIDVQILYLQADDTTTAIELVGKSTVPILAKNQNIAMAQSLDIASYFCKRAKMPLDHGDYLTPASKWVETYLPTFLRLTLPRWPQLALPEFGTLNAIAHYIDRKEAFLGATFADILAHSNEDITTMDRALDELSWLDAPDEISWADVAIFPFLRNLTVVKGLRTPEHIQHYVHQVATMSNIRTFTDVAV